MAKKKVVSIEDRIPQLKNERRKKANRRLVFYLTVFFILIGIIVYLQSPLSQVKEVIVEENEHLSDEEIIKQSTIDSSDNFWGVNLSEIEKKVQNHEQIKEVEISRKFPTSLKIIVSEHKHVGYIKKDKQYVPILENGKRMASVSMSNLKADAPLLTNFTDEKLLIQFAEELGKLSNHVKVLISQVTWIPSDSNKYKIILYMNDGFEVEASIRNFANSLSSYPSIASQLDEEEPGRIKINDGGAVFTPYEREMTDEVIEDETEG